MILGLGKEKCQAGINAKNWPFYPVEMMESLPLFALFTTLGDKNQNPVNDTVIDRVHFLFREVKMGKKEEYFGVGKRGDQFRSPPSSVLNLRFGIQIILHRQPSVEFFPSVQFFLKGLHLM